MKQYTGWFMDPSFVDLNKKLAVVTAKKKKAKRAKRKGDGKEKYKQLDQELNLAQENANKAAQAGEEDGTKDENKQDESNAQMLA
jgi:hypothetical protein